MKQFEGWVKYRVVSEENIVEILLAHGWRYEVSGGRRAEAEQAARAALHRFLKFGLPHQSRDGMLYFDPVEVQNFVRWAGRNCGDPTWAQHFIHSARRHEWEGAKVEVDLTRPPTPDLFNDAAYHITIRRRFNLRDHLPGERLRLRVPLPLKMAEVTALETMGVEPEDLAVQTSISPGRLDAILAVPRDRLVEIGIRATFRAPLIQPCPNERPTDMEFELFTRPSEGLVQVTPQIRRLAADLAGDTADGLQIVRCFWDFFMDHLACGAIHYDRLDSVDPLALILAEGWFDCQTGSALFVAMCRARDIPARLVSGYFLDQLVTGFHTWLEVWIDGQGWLALDLTSWDLSAGGQDLAWRTHQFGWINSRLIVERPPKTFCGLGSLRLRGAWLLLARMERGGVAYTFQDVETGELIYRETITVRSIG